MEPVRWKNGVLEAIDQTALPERLTYVRMRSPRQVARAISSMKVRGAPLIGIVGAYGLVLAAKQVKTGDMGQALRGLRKWADALIATRPTGINLRWAVERVYKASARASIPSRIEEEMLREADSILREELDSAHKIGKFGASLLENNDIVLTHCNAGALATAGYGTALAVIRAAIEEGKHISVIATETRPLLQGSRLTAFELARENIPVKLICDSAAAQVLGRGGVNKVVVGADRVLRTGYVTNKIGTLPIALAAKFFGIPFYVAAPVSTLDLLTEPSKIVIEERDPVEVLQVGGRSFAPHNVKALNPAFDITPPELVTGIITDRGVALAPFEKSLQAQLI